MRDFHVVLLSYVDTTQFPNNKASRFSNNLALPMEMKGEWVVAMEDFVCIGKHTLSKPKLLFVCCKLAGDSFVGNYLMPMLRSITFQDGVDRLEHSFDRLDYKRVQGNFVNSIEMEIRDEYNEVVTLGDDVKVMVVLHFKQMQ